MSGKSRKVPVRRKAAQAKTTEGEEQHKAPAPPPPETQTARTPAAQKAEETRKRVDAQVRKDYVEAMDEAERDRARARGAEPAPKAGRDTGPKGRYVLLAGVHIEDGQEYRYDRGQETVVESSRPLDELFMNKFRKKDQETHPGRDFREGFDRAGLMDPPMAERKPHGQATTFSRDTDEKAERGLFHSRGEEYPPDEEEEAQAHGEEEEEEGVSGGEE